MSYWGSCCCAECCVCTLLDKQMDDPDGVAVIEEWDTYFIQDENLVSEQVDEGSTINCQGADSAADPPCRKLIFEHTQDLTQVAATAIVYTAGIYVRELSHIGTPDKYYAATNGAGFEGHLTSSQLTIVNTVLGQSAVYEPAAAPTWIANRGINWASLQAPITYNFVSGDWAGAPATAIIGSPIWNGVTQGEVWWRWYAATQWQPDGITIPQLGWCHDGYNVIFDTLGLNGSTGSTVGGQAVFKLALKQGSHRAFANSGPDWYTIWWDNDWFQNGHPLRPIDDIAWTEFDANFASVAYVPDLSGTADPITFGIERNLRASGSFHTITEELRLDRFCFRRSDP